MLWQVLATAIMISAGFVLAVWPHRRPAAIALAAVAVGWGALLVLEGEPIIGMLQAAAGIAAGAIISLAELRSSVVNRSRLVAGVDEPIAPLFRLLVVVMGTVIAYGLSRTLPLQPGHLASLAGFAWYWLIIVGLTVLLLGRTLPKAAYGMILLSIAGPSLYAVISSQVSLGVNVTGTFTTMTIALLTAYLTAGVSSPSTGRENKGRGS